MREMDLRIFWGILLKNIRVIVLISVALALILAVSTELLTEDSYSSKCTMYVMNITKYSADNTTGISSAGLDASQRMVNEYIQMLKSETVLRDVQKELVQKNSKYSSVSVSAIKGSLSMTALNDTAMLQITATTGNKDLSKDICDALQKCAPDHVKRMMLGIGHVEPVDYAKEGSLRKPDTVRNGVLGAILGFVISCGLSVVMYLMDNTVKDERDLKARFEVNVLGVVPSFDNGTHKSKKKKKAKTDYSKTDAATNVKGGN